VKCYHIGDYIDKTKEINVVQLKISDIEKKANAGDDSAKQKLQDLKN